MKKRNIQLDLIRSIAIILVVLNHAVETYFNGTSEVMVGFNKYFAIVFFTLGRLGVPLFLILSGYLLLTRNYDTDQKCILFWKNKLIPLFFTWEIWIVIYCVYLSWFNNSTLDFKYLIKCVLFLEQVQLPHVWYMYMLIGMYISFPIISSILKKYSLKTLIFPIIIVYICSMVIPSCNIILELLGKGTYSIKLSLWINGGAYAIYLIIGYYLKVYKNLTFKTWQNILGFFINLIIIVIIYTFRCNSGNNYRVWYDFALLPIMSYFLFNILYNVKVEYISNIVKNISKYSFGIYLVHFPIKHILYRYFLNISFSRIGLIFIMTFLCFGISYLIVKIISKFKPLNKLLFLINE